MKCTDDRVRLIAELCHNPADQRATARVPFQIDRAMRGLAMDFGPAMRATGPLMFSGNQIKPPELRIGHDFFPQRSTPGRDDLDHRLHPPRFNRKIISFAMFVWRKGLSRVSKQRAVHHVNIDITLFRVSKCARQSADDLEP